MIINCGKNELSRITGKPTGIIMTEKKNRENEMIQRENISRQLIFRIIKASTWLHVPMTVEW